MLAFFPVIDDQLDVFADVRKSFFLLKKTLDGHLGVSFINGILLDRGGIKNEWNALFSQFFICIYVAFEFYPILDREIDITKDDKGLFRSIL